MSWTVVANNLFNMQHTHTDYMCKEINGQSAKEEYTVWDYLWVMKLREGSNH